MIAKKFGNPFMRYFTKDFDALFNCWWIVPYVSYRSSSARKTYLQVTFKKLPLVVIHLIIFWHIQWLRFSDWTRMCGLLYYTWNHLFSRFKVPLTKIWLTSQSPEHKHICTLHSKAGCTYLRWLCELENVQVSWLQLQRIFMSMNMGGMWHHEY